MLGPFATASRRTPIHHVSILSHWLLESRGWRCISMPNFVTISQSVVKILRFFHFQDGGRPPSWICLGHIWTTNSEYLGVSVTLQNLVMIDAVVFTARRLAKRGICRHRVSVCLSVCVCVCPSHSGIVSKRLNVGSRKQRRTIAP